MSEIQHGAGERKGESSAPTIWTAPYSARSAWRVDITRAGCDRAAKAGKPTPGEVLAPSAALVFPTLRALKAASTDAERDSIWTGYRAAYLDEIRARWRGGRRAEIEALLERPHVVLVCFCVGASRCHRTIAAEILAKIGAGIGARYHGEIQSARP